MERVNITIGPPSFDHADYDAENDVLVSACRRPADSRGRGETERHVVRYAPGTSQ